MVESLPARPTAVLIPVKAFSCAKGRLAAAFDASTRSGLARAMATRVVSAASDLPVAVVCDDDEVAEWATTVGAEVIWRPGRGLNAAVNDGVEVLADQGMESVIVSHADLPGATDLTHLARFDGVTLVPDLQEDGTNVICIPTRANFRFSYGSKSFARHRSEAIRLNLPYRILKDPSLGWDIDTPEDLTPPSGMWVPEPLSVLLGHSAPAPAASPSGADPLR